MKLLWVLKVTKELFKLITDHKALKEASQKRYIHERLAKWLDSLVEYEFQIAYREG